jgi:hypothetical protein
MHEAQTMRLAALPDVRSHNTGSSQAQETESQAPGCDIPQDDALASPETTSLARPAMPSP